MDTNVDNIELLLASKSPRRRQLLSELGLKVSFIDIDVDETLEQPLPAPIISQTLAQRKSQGYMLPLLPHQVLVTADTIVVHQGEVMGKPHGREEAYGMLQRLANDTHQVYTGVCLRNAMEQRLFTERTDVHFRILSREQIDYYLDHYQYRDKAGAYGIQEWIGMVAVDRLEGCYYNVMGLPLSRLYHELQQLPMQ
jgi:septum formation protein